MQPHPPQLPTDAPTSLAPKKLKKGALLLLLAVAVLAALIAFLLPKKQVEASQTPTSSAVPATPRAVQQHAQAYKDPVQ